MPLRDHTSWWKMIRSLETKGGAQKERLTQSLIENVTFVEEKETTDLGSAHKRVNELFEYRDEQGISHTFVAAEESWIVIQSRGQFGNPDDYFVRNWTQYEEGFGVPGKEFWLGLRHLHGLTSTGRFKVKFEMEDWDGSRAYAEYSTFMVFGAEVFKLTKSHA